MDMSHICPFKNTCNGACNIIIPYQYPQNFNDIKEKHKIIASVKLFMLSDKKIQQEIVNHITHYTLFNTDEQNLNMVKSWCANKLRGL